MIDHVRATFGQILAGRGFSNTDVTQVRLSLAFSAGFPVDLLSTHARLEAGGRCFEKAFPLPPNDVLAELQREKGTSARGIVSLHVGRGADRAAAARLFAGRVSPRRVLS
jgi:hypothetical protein